MFSYHCFPGYNIVFSCKKEKKKINTHKNPVKERHNFTKIFRFLSDRVCRLNMTSFTLLMQVGQFGLTFISLSWRTAKLFLLSTLQLTLINFSEVPLQVLRSCQHRCSYTILLHDLLIQQHPIYNYNIGRSKKFPAPITSVHTLNNQTQMHFNTHKEKHCLFPVLCQFFRINRFKFSGLSNLNHETINDFKIWLQGLSLWSSG